MNGLIYLNHTILLMCHFGTKQMTKLKAVIEDKFFYGGITGYISNKKFKKLQ